MKHFHNRHHNLPLFTCWFIVVVIAAFEFVSPLTRLLAQPCLNRAPVTNECVEAGLRQKREALRKLSEFQGRSVDTHLKLAALLVQQGDPNGAIEEYQAALALNPSLSEAYRDLGAVYIDKHKWENAELALRRSTTLNHQDHRAWYWLGRSLIAQEHFPQARKTLVTAIQIDPTNPQLLSDLGLVLMAQGQIIEAGETLSEAIRLQPDFAEAHNRLERVHDAQDNPKTLILSARIILDILFRR